MTQVRDFDSVAAEWDKEPRRVKLSSDIAIAIMNELQPAADWSAMDFGCGTGLVTLRLAPHLGAMVAVDSSRGMLVQLDDKLRAAGIGNVTTAHADELLGHASTRHFQLITSAMTLHHVQDLPELLKCLRRLLLPGGHVALADLEAEDGSFHDDPTGVFHHGFSREQLQELLDEAGFVSVSIKRITEVVKGQRSYPVLLATAAAPV